MGTIKAFIQKVEKYPKQANGKARARIQKIKGQIIRTIQGKAEKYPAIQIS